MPRVRSKKIAVSLTFVDENDHPRGSARLSGDATALCENDRVLPSLRKVPEHFPEWILPPSSNQVARFRAASNGATRCRARVHGKFIFVGDEKLYVRGVTYGTFRPNEQGEEFPAPEVVERDFALMAANGVNAVRTYTPPPLWLMDAAHRHGLRIMAGLPVERSVAFLDYRKCARALEEMVRTEVRARAGHPAILCYTIGNEIPASIVRWHGRRRLERFLARLYYAVKAEDPECLVTYVNYPSTEYLQLAFLDFACFNVYLESQKSLDAYLARLHNIAGDRPLVMAEMGLDSLRHGEATQAQVLGWQVRTSFAAGCAGVFVYAWTDEWFRGGAEVEDWMFGITARNRALKPALTAVREAFNEVPFMEEVPWPRVSVVVCSYNGARTIRDCLEGLQQLEYPDCEIIVVDDGSTDGTAAIAREYDCREIRTENRGLSNARNTGWQAANGDIVAYIDDDALNMANAGQAAVGGPNIPPATDGPVAECFAHAPGGPTHVLLSDRVAEHIPGCNMAFRRSCLEAIGGFDPQFRVAGDDVDVCWRLQKKGWTLGFNPAAVVWHHRRNSVRAYLRQQKGYGKAEALLEKKWPEKYNVAGHLKWAGRVYGVPYVRWRARRVYHGVWGLAPFQSLYEPAAGMIDALPMMPEWYLIIAILGVLSALSAYWPPLKLALPLFAFAIGAPLAQASRCAARVCFTHSPASRAGRMKLRLTTACLYLLQPLARLDGRLRHGLTLWRKRVITGFAFPRPWLANLWSKRSLGVEERLHAIEAALRAHGCLPMRGGNFDPWDLEVRGGLLGSARMFIAVEYHGDGRQLLRIRSWPRCSLGGMALTVLFAALSVGAVQDQAWYAGLALGAVTLLLASRAVHECAAATAAFLGAVRKIEREEKGDGPV
ncbi:MAG: glycosyl transferase [Verrucomicrobia bacterium]|nr:MAG: glycosyl transferase [Verrucomicrobiota bacterium]